MTDVRDLLTDAAGPIPDVPVDGLRRAVRRGARLRRRRLTATAAIPTALLAVVALLGASVLHREDAPQRVRTVPVAGTTPGTAKGTAPTASMRGGWRVTGSMANPRYAHTATLLASGKVLVAGGAVPGPGGPASTQSAATAELYDPTNGRWRSTGSMTLPRAAHTATLLPSGKVLVAGGQPATGEPRPQATATAELYDPASGKWSATGSMAVPRSSHTATLLSTGKVLVAGGAVTGPGYGGAQPGAATATAELYDPDTGTWTATAAMAVPRYAFTATLLPDGHVLVAGGSTGTIPTADAELYDPATGSWRGAGSMATPKANHTATLLPGPTVLVAGGFTGTGTTSDAELYDATMGTWSQTGPLLMARENSASVLTRSGKVLVAGGDACCGGAHFAEAELYDPATGSWSNGSMTSVRQVATATLLHNGEVLITGGGVAGAELYRAPKSR